MNTPANDGQERAACLQKARLIVIKIGSAVLADPDSLNMACLRAIAAQVAEVAKLLAGRRIIIVSSGAVAAGRAIMAAHDRPQAGGSETARQALAAIGQARLMEAWNSAFFPLHVVTAQALLTRDDFCSRERFQHAANTFSEMLSWNVLPIVNENDTVAVHELRFGDNDCLASLLVNMVEADLFINLTSARGVLGANPEKNPHSAVLSRIADIAALDIESLCGAKTSVGSGGMRSKLLAARRVAQLGVPTLILPGREPGALLQSFVDPECDLGTWICPGACAIPRRKFWLAYQSAPKGAAAIDQGAVDALLRAGGSLLPGGITGVDGDFEKGALIKITSGGEMLGVGFCNYDSASLRQIMGRKRHEIAAILGDPRYPDAVHRDNLLLDAAF